MSGIAGVLNVADSQRVVIGTLGQRLVFDASNQLLADYSEEVLKMWSVFIDHQTEDYMFRYLLPGGGELQRLGEQAPAGAVKRYNKYDVAFPLRGYGAQFGGNDVDLAYMTIAELDVQLDNIILQGHNTLRRRILTSIFEDTNFTFTDPTHGGLTVTRLANTDGTLYPPVVGSSAEAQDDHYILAGYAVSAIADTIEPHVTLRDEIAEHFGGIGSVGRSFVYFHANDQLPYLEALTGYVAISDRFIQEGDHTAIPSSYPDVPGRVHGRHGGVWLSEWDGRIPDTYGICVLLEVPAPLIMRTDTAKSGLGSGLKLVATQEEFPFEMAHYRHRFGLGCGNRLSAAVIQIDSNGSYSPPSDYSE